uniref:Uncharacterized protein n=1 Tax=Periophthalmus magnuspinnatus TaxID=409849 RepID=A0A3B4ADN9_9GOBI
VTSLEETSLLYKAEVFSRGSVGRLAQQTGCESLRETYNHSPVSEHLACCNTRRWLLNALTWEFV